MTEENTTPTEGTATPAPTEPPTTTQPPETPTPAAAQNTETGATEPTTGAADHMIPKGRFDEINSKLKEAEKRLKAIEKAEAEAQANRAKADEEAAKEQGRWKELYEAQQAKITEIEAAKSLAESAAKAAQLAAMRTKVAAAKGLPPEWHDRLRGETEEDITADAELLAGTIAKPPIHTQTDAAAGTNGKQPTPAKSETEIIEEAARMGVDAVYLKEYYDKKRMTA